MSEEKGMAARPHDKDTADRLANKEPGRHYPHDCVRCVFLGAYNGHDLYYCDQRGAAMENRPNPTVIARYGAEGPDYTSGIAIARMHNLRSAVTVHDKPINVSDPQARALRVALIIAIDMGLLDEAYLEPYLEPYKPKHALNTELVGGVHGAALAKGEQGAADG